ncbi:RNA methyltransferase [Ornithinimicrobium faecis]|uniref:RNA methyltransferase n=1 Tax=Ornithinimicrobium faecis TaxID=2934158 RepID=A0ABY4YQ46_9MICO|nr:RNA methyltransferase [Ornithinimicrobium sp. HY1793]USQ78395.1 RNA methyltransferase [Ornithinimicrobium sp. HY1793]
MTTDPDLLSNARSERVRSVRSLGRRAVRERQRLFVVEGPQGVRELLSYAGSVARDLYLTPSAAERHADIVGLAEQAGVRVRPCTDEVLAAMTDTPHPQGMIAVAAPVDVPLAEALAAVGDGFVAVLTNVRDPGNAGTVLRAADAFGASAVLVSDASVDIYNPKVVRSTVGSLFHLPVSVGTPVAELLAACQAAGLRILAADGSGTTSLPDADLSVPHAWVMGNEAWGLEPEVRDLCDDVVSIPIVRAESLNLAMAATVCLHASSSRMLLP